MQPRRRSYRFSTPARILFVVSTSLTAAAMREDGSAIELADGVTVVSGIRRFSASALTLDVGRATITGKGECLLEDGGAPRRVQTCRTDVFLREGLVPSR